MSLRRIVSLTLFLSILVMLVTSIILFIVPQGRVAYWSDWMLWGISKTQWGNIHTNTGFLMLIAGSFHIYYNWRPITAYMKNKARQFKLFTPNFNVALGLMALFVGLTLAGVPPLVWIQDLREKIEDDGAAELGEPPYGHAEESSLQVFFRNVGLDPNLAKENLAAAGVEGVAPEIIIIDLAHANGMSPQALYEIMLGPQDQRPTGALPIPESMPRGSGRKTLTDFCSDYNKDLGEAVRLLENAGWRVDSQLSLKDIAAENGKESLDLLDILREGFGP
ncbi:MAG: DUF4405 domain-containing protein [Gemmatimonadales bacterium]|nr:DUF4405 domain-containing protein [Gemmatimonadales bacterium]